MKCKIHETLIELRNISMQYGDKIILRDIYASIRDHEGHGQVVGILGPSGCGKTTLIKVLAGLQKPTTGEIIVNKNDKYIPVKAGLVGLVGQRYPLLKHRCVLTNLMLAAEMNGLNEKDARDKSVEYLTRFNLAEHAYLFPAQLSGGQQQRVAIIQQLLCSEHYILMDEPFSGLDPLMKDNVCKLITEVANMHEKNTIVVVTHDIDQAICVSDQLWLMGKDKGVQGAYLKEAYDLVEKDLAWKPEIYNTDEFADFKKEIHLKFKDL